MNTTLKNIIFDAFVMLVLMTLVFSAYYLDIFIFQHGMPENSMTEFFQSLCLIFVVSCFLTTMRKHDKSKGLWLILVTLFLLMLIREQDHYLDSVYHGFWKIPAAIVFFVGSVAIVCNKNTIIPPLLHHYQNHRFTYIFIGLFLLVIFSRVFGSGVIWRELMGSDYSIIYKSVIQEGLELLGYCLILFGSFKMCLSASDWSTHQAS